MSHPRLRDAPVAALTGAALIRRHGRADRTILDGLDLRLVAGRLVGLSGASGSGKSTLINLLCGELPPTTGSAEIRTADGLLPAMAARRREPGCIGLVSQDARATLDPLWSIRRSVEQPLRLTGIAAGEARARATAALARVGLGHIDHRLTPGRISIGQCQRVVVARALVAGPRVVLADEPTSALDVTTAAAIARLLLDARDAGAAVLVASHDTRLLDSISDVRLHIEGTRVGPCQPEGTGGK